MSVKKLFWIILLSLGFQTLPAQSPEDHKCGNDLVQQEAILANPDYARELENYLREELPRLAESANARNVTALISIPVVVHVIHGGEAVGNGSNISVSRIVSQLEILNEDYRRLNDDASNTPSSFASVAADVEIEFCLAKVDPNGNTTDGITRDQYSNVSSINFIENNIKPATSWDSDRYLNIWTLDMPSSNIVGYAYLPTSTMVGSIQDGVVINYLNFGFINSGNRGRTATHEVGHYLGLQHPWGANDSNGNPIGCTSDDGVSDTPNSDGPYYGCPNSGASCGSNDMFMNYMDYVDDYCMNIFTSGQKNIMQNVLTGIRSPLANNASAACQFSCLNLAAGNDLEMGFESNQSFSGWIVENANNDNRSWTVTENSTDDWGPNNGSGLAVYLWNSAAAADDYLFTPCFQVVEGHTYELRFAYACGSDDTGLFPERFEVGFSAQQSSDDFFTIGDSWIFDPVNNDYPNYENASLLFIANSSGSVSLGFHAFSDADQYALQIDDIQIIDLGMGSPATTLSLDQSFELYPNPNQGQFTVDLAFEEAQKEINLKVYDVLGQEVLTQSLKRVQNEQVQVNLTDVNTGIYFVSIQTGKNTITRRVVIE